MVEFKTIRGVRDILYPESSVWDRIERKTGDIFRKYGYRKVYFPVIEYSELFSRSIGEDTDIVSKEMYTFEDRKGRLLSLRPEGTAGCVRSMIEHNRLNGRVREKVFYVGPMFRYERPQEGRYRQFYQIGCEVFGSGSPSADAEILEIADRIMKECGIAGFDIRINSVGCEKCRGKYREEIKKFLEDKEDELCEDCRRRKDTNTLRILDCKNENCQHVYADLPLLSDYLCEDCRYHMDKYEDEIRNKRDIGIAQGDMENERIIRDNRLVRGLDYYTGPVFEIETGGCGTIIAGGRYDRLVKQLGGPDVPACGWALGMERLFSAATMKKTKVPELYMAFLQGGDRREMRAIAAEFRKMGVSVEEDYEDMAPGKKFKLADKKGAEWVMVFGEEEAKHGKVTLKDLKTGEQEILNKEDAINRLGLKNV